MAEKTLEQLEQDFEKLLASKRDPQLIAAYLNLKSRLYQIMIDANKALEALEKKVG